MTAKYFLKNFLRQNENKSKNLEELFKVLKDFITVYQDWSGHTDQGRAEVAVITKTMEELRFEMNKDVATALTQEAIENNFISEDELWEQRLMDSYYVEEF